MEELCHHTVEMNQDIGTIEEEEVRRNSYSTDVPTANFEGQEDTTSHDNVPSSQNSLKEQTKEEDDVQCSSDMEADATMQLRLPPLESEPPSSLATTATKNDDLIHPPAVPCSKVKVHFVAVGNAPILKKSKFKIDPNVKFGYVINSLRRTLSLDSTSSSNPAQSKPSLFLYCNAAFVPSLDERLGDLNDCFSIRGELVIHYSLKEAWG